MNSLVPLRTLIFVGLLLDVMMISGCQFAVRRTSIWIYPAPTFPARSAEVGDGNQVLVPAYAPEGNSFSVGMRFVPINAENKDMLTTSNLIRWPEKIKKMMKKKADEDQ
jgi:hypothetical protein